MRTSKSPDQLLQLLTLVHSGAPFHKQVLKSGYAYLVDESGFIIAYRDVALVKNRVNVQRFPGINHILAMNPHIHTEYVSFTNESVVGLWEPVARTQWKVVVEVPKKEIMEEMHTFFVVSGICIVVFLLSLIIVLAIIYRTILIPISTLQQGVQQVRKGNLDTGITVHARDEIGELTTSFNQMTKDLDTSKNELVEYGKKLEKTVSERTKELKQKVDELERFNKLVVNRELKMIELKEEIQKLKQKLDAE